MSKPPEVREALRRAYIDCPEWAKPGYVADDGFRLPRGYKPAEPTAAPATTDDPRPARSEAE
jgi:hypothetical protein